MPVVALIAAVLAASPPPARPAVGGPYEPVEVAGPEIVVESPAPRTGAWTIQPDRRLQRRYGPPPYRPRGRPILRF